MYTRLAMGSSHSIHILMDINTTAIGKTLVTNRKLAAEALTSLAHHRGLTPEDIPPSVPEEPEPEPLVKDSEWYLTSDLRRQPDLAGAHRQSSGFSVEEWVEACREARRSLERVFIIVHLFSGVDREFDIKHYVLSMAATLGFQVLFLNADLSTDWRWDLAHAATFAILMSLAEGGFIDIILGGPPCGTWSRARFNRAIQGPRPLRFRGSQCWGRSDLTAAEKARVSEANILMIHFLTLCEVVAKLGGGYL